jgi:UDP-N-acetylglucosamine 2-epimerase
MLTVTSSGRIKEKVYILKKPNLINENGNNERQKIVKVKANKVIVWKKGNIIKELSYLLN